MSLEQIAQIFNLTCVCVVLVVSLWIHRSHSSVFFRQWLMAYGFGAAMLLSDVPSLLMGRPASAGVVQVALCVVSAWYFVQTGLALTDRRWPRKWLGVALAVSVVASAVALVAGAPFSNVSAVPLLVFSASVVWLGVTFFRVVGATRGARLGWLGAIVVALGVIPLAYPFVLGTPGFLVGLWAAGVAHLAVGFGMVFFLMDEAIRQTREENQRLLAQERARTNFLSTVSHELRTPLTSIMGNLEFLEDGLGGGLSPEQETFAREMRHGADHLAGLIESLLDSSQINAGALSVHMGVVDLPDTIRTAVATTRALAERRGVQVKVSLPDRLPLVSGDLKRIMQVLINLIGNATKFTPAGGTVELSAGLRESVVWVAVSDTGIGIPEERQGQIFEPFFQVDNSLTRSHGGSGLGLWIVKNLITAMNGEITVESAPGAGATFRFTLGIAPEQSVPAAGEASFSTTH